MQTTINQRVEELIFSLENGKQKRFAERIDVAPTVINNIVGNRKSEPSFKVLQKIVETYSNVDLQWLITGKGDMIKTTEDKQITVNEKLQEYTKRSDKRVDDQEIPLYEHEAAAGLTKLFSNSENVLDFIRVPNLPKCDGAVHISGDSMYPLLKSGDIVMYKQIHDIANGIFWGEMYLLSLVIDGEDYTLVKYIQRSEIGSDYVKLVSQNQHHSPKDVELKSIRALALIKASIRINSMA